MGSAIGMCGSLVSRNADSLVTSIAVRALRLSDGTEYLMEGLFSRSRILSSKGGDTVEMQPRQLIELPVDKPRPYDIIFCNDGDRIFFKELAEELQAAWGLRMTAQIDPPHDLSIPDNAKRIATKNQVIFRDQQNAPFISGMVARMLSRFFWVAGSYEISLEVGVDNSAIFRKPWRITVSADMEQKLRLNALRLVAAGCSQPPAVVGQVYSAWPAYEPVPLG